MRSLLVVEARGHSGEVLDVIEAMNWVSPAFYVLGVVDDRLDTYELLARGGFRGWGRSQSSIHRSES